MLQKYAINISKDDMALTILHVLPSVWLCCNKLLGSLYEVNFSSQLDLLRMEKVLEVVFQRLNSTICHKLMLSIAKQGTYLK